MIDQQFHLDLTWVMLIKLTGCRTSTNRTIDIRDSVIFDGQWHNLNKHGRGSQDNAKKHNSKALGLVISDKKICYVFGPRGIT